MYFSVLVVAYLCSLLVTSGNVCPCYFVRSPVYGSNGQTYSNECVFNCEARESNGTLKLVKQGEC